MNVFAVFYLGYKDIMRQRKILFFVLAALTIGITNTVVTVGLIKGFENHLNEDVVQVIFGHIIIRPPIGKEYFEDPHALIDKVEAIGDVRLVSPRNYILAEILPYGKEARREFSVPIPNTVVALDPEREAAATSIKDKIVEGEYFTGERGEILIGELLADRLLGLEIGDKVSVKFPGGKRIMTVRGKVRTGARGLDFLYGYITEEEAERILGEKKYNYLLVDLYNRDKADHVKAEMFSLGIEGQIKTWEESLGFIQDILLFLSVVLFIVTGISILAASASIAVMTYINVKRKTKQIGTLKAVGVSPQAIFSIYVGEAVIMGVLGILCGLTLSALIIIYFTINPIYITPYTYLRFAADFGVMGLVSAVTIGAVIGSAFFPAMMASRLEVVESLRGGR